MGRARRRRAGRRDLDSAREPRPIPDDWIYFGGQRTFIVGLTPGGAPFGFVEDEEPSYFED